MISVFSLERLYYRASLLELSKRGAVDPDDGGCAALNVARQAIKYISTTFGKEACLGMKERGYPNAKTDYLNCEIVEKQVVRFSKAGQNKAKSIEYSLTI